MVSEYKRRTNIGLGLGMLLQVIGGALYLPAIDGSVSQLLGGLLALGGLGLFIWGCANFAQSKGQPAWLGILGLLTPVGLVILIMLPDRLHGGGIEAPA